MKITYRAKNICATICIQVVSDINESLVDLIIDLQNKGFRYCKSPIPLSFPNKDNTTTSYFYRDGTDKFGLKELKEIDKFISDSRNIIKKYDNDFSARQIYLIDND